MRKIDVGKGVTVVSPLHSVEEAAAWCGLSRRAFLTAADAAGLPYARVGQQRRYRERDLRAWVAGRVGNGGLDEEDN